MKFLLMFIFGAVFVQSLTIKENLDEMRDSAQIRNKRQINYNPPNFNLPAPKSPFSGNFLGGGSSLGLQGNYDTPKVGASASAVHNFDQPRDTRALIPFGDTPGGRFRFSILARANDQFGDTSGWPTSTTTEWLA